jgi:alpha-galactosidase
VSKIVIIGAGSVSFGPAIINDLLLHIKTLAGSEVWLVDINADALEVMYGYAQRLNREIADTNPPLNLFATTDRRSALPNADFVIVSVAVDRIATWKLDWQIPIKHGVRHVLGENGGPGGLSHALRNIPLLLAIARDIEALAPNAWLLNFSNPMSRLCMALHLHSKIRFVGLCHQIGEGYRLVNQVLKLVPEPNTAQEMDAKALAERTRFRQTLESRIHLTAAGLNHFTFILDMRDRETGQDLYPRFRQLVNDMPQYWELLSRRMLDAYGLFCATGDGHAGEYVGFAAETMPMKGYDFDKYEAHSQNQWGYVKAIASGVVSAQPLIASGERAVPIMCAMIKDLNQYELAVNVVNRGCIENISSDAIVEVPALVNGRGVNGLHVGALPRGLAAFLQREVEVQSLCVEAAVKGDRKAALQALLLDPHIHSFTKANYLLDDILRAHAKYLPQFGYQSPA